ncbi:MAG: rRNA maturation RNase YbeY, partial [Bacteroidota bacterium]
DDYLLKINQDYLDHHTYTDIITFDQSTEDHQVESDIFISLDRITENSKNLGVSFERELHRVMIHGVLHLLGYQDKTPEQKSQMREKEDACLSLLDI